MLAGIGRMGSKTDSGTIAAPPATISTTIVSPKARLMPSMTAVPTPESAYGKVTSFRVSQGVAPKASEASFKACGTACRASSEIEQIVGTAMKASISEALKRLSPVAIPRAFCSHGATSTIPIKPITTEGSAAKSSIKGLTIRRVLSDATSERYAAVARPSGTAIRLESTVTASDPAIREPISKSGASPTGYQSVPKMNLSGVTWEKTGSPSRKR